MYFENSFELLARLLGNVYFVGIRDYFYLFIETKNMRALGSPKDILIFSVRQQQCN